MCLNNKSCQIKSVFCVKYIQNSHKIRCKNDPLFGPTLPFFPDYMEKVTDSGRVYSSTNILIIDG